MKIQKKSLRFFVKYGLLFRKWFNQAPLRCIEGDKVDRVLQEVHVGKCGEHKGTRGYLSIVCISTITGRPWKLIPYLFLEDVSMPAWPTVTECYTKWVEAVVLKRTSEIAVANFIRDSIICRVGIPKSILSGEWHAVCQLPYAKVKRIA